MAIVSRTHGRPPRHPIHDPRLGGWYFITIVTEGRQWMFGRVAGDQLLLTTAGCIVEQEWRRTEEIRYEVTLGPWVVMPDHFHGLIQIEGMDQTALPEESDVSALHRPPHSIGSVIGTFKAACTGRINQLHGTPGRRIWQTNYWDRIVRDQRMWDTFARYIHDNPVKLLGSRR